MTDINHADTLRQMVAAMLQVGKDELEGWYPGLMHRVLEVDQFVQHANPVGNLSSTQVVAAIVEQYLREQRNAAVG